MKPTITENASLRVRNEAETLRVAVDSAQAYLPTRILAGRIPVLVFADRASSRAPFPPVSLSWMQMAKMKAFLRRYRRAYATSQRVWHAVRRFFESRLLGSRVQEWSWSKRHWFAGRSWSTSYLASVDHPHRSQISEAVQSFEPLSSLLEVGCNAGPNLIVLRQRFPSARLVGVDINAEAVKAGRTYMSESGLQNMELRIGKADELDWLPDKSVDVALADAILMFIAPDKIGKVLSGMARVASKGLVLNEYHSPAAKAGEYFGGRWVYDYGFLIERLLPLASYEIVHSNFRGPDWDRFGSVIKVSFGRTG